FPDDNDKNAFRFLDPSLVIHGHHLIPTFSEGQTDILVSCGESTARKLGETEDWSSFYVYIFVDQDMFAHFTGTGVGHLAWYMGPPAMTGIVGNSK
ncbi:hypothetical protein PAXRUDRAFT_47859, partial [Paxillus rubicundulus Ve08.2h10]